MPPIKLPVPIKNKFLNIKYNCSIKSMQLRKYSCDIQERADFHVYAIIKN